MPLNAQGYFNGLKSYLNLKHYGILQNRDNEIQLKEKLFGQAGVKATERIVNLTTSGDVLVIKLDAVKSGASAPLAVKNSLAAPHAVKDGSSTPLFHFLDDNAKPWSKRCDFVVFNLRRNRLFVYCIEFKSESIPHDVPEQLRSSVAWCKALHATINAYTQQRGIMNVTKYVFSNHANPSPYLDEQGKYLNRDHTIRHYLYRDLAGLALADLDNTNIEVIR